MCDGDRPRIKDNVDLSFLLFFTVGFGMRYLRVGTFFCSAHVPCGAASASAPTRNCKHSGRAAAVSGMAMGERSRPESKRRAACVE